METDGFQLLQLAARFTVSSVGRDLFKPFGGATNATRLSRDLMRDHGLDETASCVAGSPVNVS